MRRQSGGELSRTLQIRDGRRVLRIEELVRRERPGALIIDHGVVGEGNVAEIEAELERVIAADVADVVLELPARFDAELTVALPVAETRKAVHRL